MPSDIRYDLNVMIGPGCNIGHVEYANRFQKTDEVLEKRRV
jgi:hypothetical protein